jgi:anti-anti-sigma regulatory factor
MKLKEVSIAVTPLNEQPYIMIQGKVDAWHASTVEDVVESFIIQGTPEITLDISRASFPDVEGLSTLIRTLRVASDEMRMSVVASDSTSAILSRANLSAEVLVAESGEHTTSVQKEYYSSRWMPRKSERRELPLAA